MDLPAGGLHDLRDVAKPLVSFGPRPKQPPCALPYNSSPLPRDLCAFCVARGEFFNRFSSVRVNAPLESAAFAGELESRSRQMVELLKPLSIQSTSALQLLRSRCCIRSRDSTKRKTWHKSWHWVSLHV